MLSITILMLTFCTGMPKLSLLLFHWLHCPALSSSPELCCRQWRNAIFEAVLCNSWRPITPFATIHHFLRLLPLKTVCVSFCCRVCRFLNIARMFCCCLPLCGTPAPILSWGKMGPSVTPSRLWSKMRRQVLQWVIAIWQDVRIGAREFMLVKDLRFYFS